MVCVLFVSAGDQPRLLTTMQPVRKGTHGGVTLLGLSGAAAGGLLAGVVFYCAAVLSPTLWVFEAQVGPIVDRVNAHPVYDGSPPVLTWDSQPQPGITSGSGLAS
jgi:hypothetical protein